MRRCYPLLLAVVLVLALPACTGGLGTYFAPTAAVVGGAKITEAQVLAELRIVATGQAQAFQALFRGPDASLNQLDAKRQILTELIRDQAVVGQAHALGVSVSPATVQASLDKVRQKFGSQAALDRQLSQTGITLDDLRRYEELTLTLKAVQNQVVKDVNATPDQIAAAYQSQQASYMAQFHPAHILICGHADPTTGVCVTTTADAELAKSVNEKALSGDDFGQLAAQYSNDAGSKSSGGDLGWIDPATSQIDKTFEAAALSLQPGQVTPQPVETQFGYHIIKLIAKGRSLADASSDINTQLEQTARNNRFNAWLQSAIARTQVRINPRYGDFDPKTMTVLAPPSAGLPSPASTGPAPAGP